MQRGGVRGGESESPDGLALRLITREGQQSARWRLACRTAHPHHSPRRLQRRRRVLRHPQANARRPLILPPALLPHRQLHPPCPLVQQVCQRVRPSPPAGQQEFHRLQRLSFWAVRLRQVAKQHVGYPPPSLSPLLLPHLLPKSIARTKQASDQLLHPYPRRAASTHRLNARQTRVPPVDTPQPRHFHTRLSSPCGC